jgi:hypothetical protein
MALKPICRINDSAAGQCTAHGSLTNWVGTIDTVSGTDFTVDGRQVAVVGDSGQATCGHRFIIVAGGVSTVITDVNGRSVAKVDSFVNMISPGNGFGLMTSGSPNCSIE